jgi:hypothetical protein
MLEVLHRHVVLLKQVQVAAGPHHPIHQQHLLPHLQIARGAFFFFDTFFGRKNAPVLIKKSSIAPLQQQPHQYATREIFGHPRATVGSTRLAVFFFCQAVRAADVT